MTNKIKDAIYTKRYVYNLHFHLIWCTKYRNKTFTNEKLSNEMKDILQRVADDNEIVIEKMEVMPDHVHMLISFPPRKSAVDVIKALKAEVHSYSYKHIQKLDKNNIGAVIYGLLAII